MNMKRFSIISLLLWIGILAFASGKPKVMWLDCSANFQRFSYPDSIRFYVDKCHEAGITHLVLDIKDNTGEVLYPSKYAAQKKNWKNFDLEKHLAAVVFCTTRCLMTRSRSIKSQKRC